MQYLVIQRMIGLLVTIFSITMLPPAIVSVMYQDNTYLQFLESFLVLLIVGVALWLPARSHKRELRIRDGFLVVVLFWTVLGIAGSLPLYLAELPNMDFTDAVFESISGLTTTGATVLVGLDELPRSILFYRQFLQWLGGMGIIVLAVAILPMLGIGGMQLYRAETPGPVKDNKLTPRIAESAKTLWYIYLALTTACALAYWIAGMTPFDAVAHSFSTIAIGGYSTHDSSIAYFDSPAIELIAVVFMFIAGINFALHFVAWHTRKFNLYQFDSEFKFYASVLVFVTLLTSIGLYLTNTYENPILALRHGLFQTVSISTTTGYATAPFYAWPGGLPVLLVFMSFMGGCAGSTGGGLKVIRVLLLLKQGAREIKRLIHPSAIIPIKVNNTPMPFRVVDAVWGFFATYVAVFALLMLAVMATGLDQISAFSAVAACLNNLGPGLGKVGAHYGEINSGAKWLLSMAMLFGRLEVFSILVILSPTFWRES